ncbi:MAG: lipoprotein [Dyella sp.]
MRRFVLLLPLGLIAASLTGCGQKGPLYMPNNPRPPVYVPPPKPSVPATPAPAATVAPAPSSSVPASSASAPASASSAANPQE